MAVQGEKKQNLWTIPNSIRNFSANLAPPTSRTAGRSNAPRRWPTTPRPARRSFTTAAPRKLRSTRLSGYLCEPMDDYEACAMTALHLRRIDPTRNMRRFYWIGGGKDFTVVRLGHDAPALTDASPFLHKQDTAKKIGLHVKKPRPVMTGAYTARAAD